MKMKNKKAEQIEAKKKHKEQLKTGRKVTPTLERGEPTLQVKPTILIVCEGKNTEPSYFQQFRLTSATVKAIGEGHNTISLVERAKQLAKDNENKYDQVWCVFDKDAFNSNDFNNAVSSDNGTDFRVAYSNQAFEYWIILHFEDHQGGAMNRQLYNDKINKLLKPFKVNYDGEDSKIITEEIFNLLMGVDKKTNKDRTQLAIKRAERNYNQHDHSNPSKEESTTTVFKLVSELLKYL